MFTFLPYDTLVSTDLYPPVVKPSLYEAVIPNQIQNQPINHNFARNSAEPENEAVESLKIDCTIWPPRIARMERRVSLSCCTKGDLLVRALIP
jgi:hypothetical protein